MAAPLVFRGFLGMIDNKSINRRPISFQLQAKLLFDISVKIEEVDTSRSCEASFVCEGLARDSFS
jgi:hypothetical protein